MEFDQLMSLNSMRQSHVYIMSNYNKTVYYIGVTSNIMNRVLAHKRGEGSVFSSKYNTKYLLYYEIFYDIESAIIREKQLKRWHRNWKINLIKQENPEMKDLANDWYSDIDFK
jgi:putative endonuclease